MKKCPNCNEETIPWQWILFGKVNGEKGRCYVCNNCGKRVKKRRIFGFIEHILYTEIGFLLLLIFTGVFSTLFDSLFTAFTFALITMILLHVMINFFVILNVADEDYCQGNMSKIEAFFGLIIMFVFIMLIVNFFIVQPLFK